jgi:TonB family protein
MRFLFLLAAIQLCIPFKLFSQAPQNDTVYDFVTKMPEYPGGQKAMLSYFIENMRYPLSAYLNGVSATAYVNFIVETDGSVSDVVVLKSIGYGCDQEAIRLVYQMKDWKPGELDGIKVRVRSNLPVYFKEELYIDSRIYTKPDTLPEFPGGIDSLFSYLKQEKTYPEKAKANDIGGMVKLNFVVEKDGSVSNLMILDSIGYGCDEEAIRVISAMPNWEPGYMDGQSVRSLLSLNLDFNPAFTVVETMPSYPGGMGELMKFLANNIKYPLQAKSNGIQGRVFINFTVEADGSISNVRVLRGIGGGCDEEAVRVIKKMPKWDPGIQKGERVRVSYNLPVKFTLMRGSQPIIFN